MGVASLQWQHFASGFMGPAGFLTLIGAAALRSLVLAAIAGLLLAIFRVRNVSLRLAAWKLVLWGALAMPLLVWLLPPVPFALPDALASRLARLASSQEASADESATMASSSEVRVTDSEVPATEMRHQAVPNKAFGARPHATQPKHDGVATVAVAPGSASWDAAPASTPVVKSTPPAPTGISGLAIAMGIYFSMVALLMSRLVIGWALGRRLIRGSQAIRDPRASLSLSLRAYPGHIYETPLLAESEAVTVPVTLGVARPVILLPSDWREWDDHKLNAVLAHELSHIGRNDALTQRLSQLHRAAYWFSPLGWWLDREIARLAEEASDEAALASGADRERYAETLLGFFEAVNAGSGRVWWQGVSMAARGDAAERVDRILSWKGAVSMRLQKSLVVALSVIALPALCATASIHFTARAEQAPSRPAAPTAAPTPATQATAVAAPAALASPASLAEPLAVASVADIQEASTPPTPATPQAAPAPQSKPAPPSHRVVIDMPEIYVQPMDVTVPEVHVQPLRIEVPSVDTAQIAIAAQGLAQARAQLAAHAAVMARVQPFFTQSQSGNATFWITDDKHVREPYIISAGGTYIGVMNHSVWVDDSGDTDDLHWAKRLRGKIGGDFIWFEHDGKGYVIRDRATIDRAMALYQPIRELSKQQEELGRQQEELGEKEEALGSQMEDVTVKIPDMTAEVDHIKERMRELAEKGGTQSELGDLQSELGELQSRIGEIQSVAGREESKIGRQQGELGRKQGELGRRQGELGRQEGQLSRKVQEQMESILDEARTKGLAQSDDAAQRD